MYPLAIISYSDNGFWIQQHSVRIHNQAVQFKCRASKKTKLVNTVEMAYVYKSAICDTLLWKKITTQKHMYIKQYVEEPKVATVGVLVLIGSLAGWASMRQMEPNCRGGYKIVQKVHSVTAPDTLQEDLPQQWC